MTLTPDEFRAVLGRFATGVTVLTTRDASGGDHGMTVSAFCSVSLSPPLVLACIAREVDMYAALRIADHFAISLLTAEQEALSRRFAELPANRFDGVPFTRSAAGAILLRDAHAHLECHRVAWHDAGDHAICLGEVERASAGTGAPLLYYRGDYARLAR